MRRFQLLPNGSKTAIQVERQCLEGMITKRNADNKVYLSVLDLIKGKPFFEKMTAAELLEWMVEVNDRYNAQDQDELDEVISEISEEQDNFHKNACEISGVCTCKSAKA